MSLYPWTWWPVLATLVGLATLAVLVPAVAGAHPPPADAPISYTVRPGDTLSEIAVRRGSSVAAIAAASGISDPDRIVVGQRLTIPRSASAAAASSTARHHVVRAGETLSGIAARYGLSITDLAAMNGIVDHDRVLVGSRLRVAGRVPAPASAPRAGATHTVAPRETLSTIAQRYGVTTRELAAVNDIADVDLVFAGQRLVVPGWRCPVTGRVRFSNDFGVPKGGGRFHEGIDLYAAAGTPVVASVPGRVERIRGDRGGLQFWLRGEDGHLYIGSHLSRFGAGGGVAAGEVVGYVGRSGNAVGGPPHLHFEFHPGARGAANPYPLLVDACR